MEWEKRFSAFLCDSCVYLLTSIQDAEGIFRADLIWVWTAILCVRSLFASRSLPSDCSSFRIFGRSRDDWLRLCMYAGALGPFGFVWIEIDCRFLPWFSFFLLLCLYSFILWPKPKAVHPCAMLKYFCTVRTLFRCVFFYNVLLIERRTMVTIKSLKAFFSSCLYSFHRFGGGDTSIFAPCATSRRVTCVLHVLFTCLLLISACSFSTWRYHKREASEFRNFFRHSHYWIFDCDVRDVRCLKQPFFHGFFALDQHVYSCCFSALPLIQQRYFNQLINMWLLFDFMLW